MVNEYYYVIIKENYPELERESTVLPSPYQNKEFAFIEKKCFKDGTEKIMKIEYSDSIFELQDKTKRYLSWYNYPLGFKKDIQGNISELN